MPAQQSIAVRQSSALQNSLNRKTQLRPTNLEPSFLQTLGQTAASARHRQHDATSMNHQLVGEPEIVVHELVYQFILRLNAPFRFFIN